jgi:transcriptional regulator GlxA family with amidase domain
MPQCGFSNNVVQILNTLGAPFETFDVLADPDIRQALNLIKSRGCSDLSAAQVATTVGVSRRLLDHKFQLALGRTIHEELQHTKVAEAKRLLAETDHKLLVVAVRAGFTHAAQLCNVFKTAVGMSPMQYRKAARPCREIDGRGIVVSLRH